MIKLALAVAAAALTLCAVAAASSTADVFTYRTVLSAGAEVPKPKVPAGAGGVFASTVTKDGTAYSIAWKLTFKKLSGPAVAAHVHRGRPGVAGSVILALCGPCRSGQSGKMTITKTVAEAMRRGTAYVNVHTAKNSAGEIRGQAKLTNTVLGQPAPAPPPPSSDPTPPPPPYDPY
jgi:CHRD domain-containing protein